MNPGPGRIKMPEPIHEEPAIKCIECAKNATIHIVNGWDPRGTDVKYPGLSFCSFRCLRASITEAMHKGELA